jgi:hypothetical protein
MSEAQSNPRVNNAVQILRIGLIIAAVLVLVSSAAMGLFWVSVHDLARSEVLLVAVACVLAGLVVAVLLIVASTIIGMLAALVNKAAAAPADEVRPALERLEQSLRLLNNLQTRSDTLAETGAARIGERSTALLEQLCDLMLMDDAQRQRCGERHWARRKQTHLEAIEREVLIGDWGPAFARLDELRIVMPEDRQIAELRERVESEQTARLDEDVRNARGRLRQLMGSALWQEAEDLIMSLRDKYPGKGEIDRLGENVRQEREGWERDNMERLFKDIATATERRQWRQATLAVEEFIRRYPLDPRAEALRLDLPTLLENAAAQERKEQEEQFKDLLKRQRYDEAILTAKAAIAKYPQSATATELNRLLPKVEELARQEALRVANQPPAPVAATPAAATA